MTHSTAEQLEIDPTTFYYLYMAYFYTNEGHVFMKGIHIMIKLQLIWVSYKVHLMSAI